MDQEPSSVAGPVVVGLFLGGSIIFGLGYGFAVMHRANDDYKKTKAAVPVLRKGFWLAWWIVVKRSFWIGLFALVLFVWAWRGGKS